MWLLPGEAPDLKRLEANPPAVTPEILVVSEGTGEDNRQTGLLSPVVLDHDYRVGDAFGVEVTPSEVAKGARRYLS